MNLLRGIIEGFREIFSHKFRSMLTTSGIVLGVASLMAMFAVVEGMTEGMRYALNRFGGVERVQIDAAEVPRHQESSKDISPGRTYQDVLALRAGGTLFAAVSPEKRLNRVVAVSHGNRRSFVMGIRGVEKEYMEMNDVHRLADGRFITDLDVDRRHRVLVLGPDNVKQLFAGTGVDPVGARVQIEGIGFTVVGAMTPSDMRWVNNRVFMPLSTMQELFFAANVQGGIDQGPNTQLDELHVKVADYDQFAAALEQMRSILLQTHRGIEDFGFRTREDWFEAIEGQVNGARLSGGMVALVCLLAGGVGITNIMLASIKERTREIGVRRAIGAQPWDIFSQITIEVFLLAIIGGVLGVVAGLGLIEVIKEISTAERQPLVRTDHIMVSFIAGVVVGLAAGFIPARKAATLEPIEALRYE
jgi:putative ABC transport system permease protein